MRCDDLRAVSQSVSRPVSVCRRSNPFESEDEEEAQRSAVFSVQFAIAAIVD